MDFLKLLPRWTRGGVGGGGGVMRRLPPLFCGVSGSVGGRESSARTTSAARHAHPARRRTCPRSRHEASRRSSRPSAVRDVTAVRHALRILSVRSVADMFVSWGHA